MLLRTSSNKANQKLSFQSLVRNTCYGDAKGQPNAAESSMAVGENECWQGLWSFHVFYYRRVRLPTEGYSSKGGILEGRNLQDLLYLPSLV
jgi:hypothetical protein